MNEKIRQVRQALQMSPKAFGERLGVTAGYVGKLEFGEEAPSKTLLKLMKHEFQLRDEWLYNGTGSMFQDPSTIDEIASNTDLSDIQKQTEEFLLQIEEDLDEAFHALDELDFLKVRDQAEYIIHTAAELLNKIPIGIHYKPND
ncbi:helix-turn-helix domain-containing protein [Paenibacillus dendritiformis]|uniref:helix-turn-helix domain-containing protein n=1 Tax=Paenibacillus dendritiformis TaxID=130049 RepID=UPI000DA73234|nr:helix-turn-helix transcriptional regulator [Paenibacillus dendritiformis]PZM65688.1 hypothetical protein DOE73_10270 [Paenibacillus dendritiformis]